MIKCSYKKIDFQGLPCYLPVLHVSNDGYNKKYVSKGDPLVFKKDALKYVHIWKNESLKAGYITYN